MANHQSDPQILGARDLPSTTALIVGFPMRATRDPDLSMEDIRVLIGVGILAGKSGWCTQDTSRIAMQTDLPKPAVTVRLDRLESRGYLSRWREGGTTTLALVPDTEFMPDSDPEPAQARPPAPVQRGTGRSVQASLHSDMLRRPVHRQSGSIEFDDPSALHPDVASLQQSLQVGVDGFRFWLRTILDPEDVEIFSGWARRRSAEYRSLIRKFDDAKDDHAIELLLEDTLALVDREKVPDR